MFKVKNMPFSTTYSDHEQSADQPLCTKLKNYMFFIRNVDQHLVPKVS